MGGNIKKGHSKNCHNNCRIHYNPDFFSYYRHQYPYSPFYPYPVPPSLFQYTLPQNISPPLLSQYNYSPAVQQPVPLQQQSSQIFTPAQPYQIINQNSNAPLSSNPMPGNNTINQPSYDNRHDYHNQQYFDDYYPPHYNSRPLVNENNYNDFRRPVTTLSVEDEYNWAIHISKILDDFIPRDRNQLKAGSGEQYSELKNTLNTSLRHLKEAEALNKTLVETWEKRNEKIKPFPSVTSSETIILPEVPLLSEQEEIIKNDAPAVLNAENVSKAKDVAEPKTELEMDELLENDDFDEDSDDEHSFFFDNAEFTDQTPSPTSEKKNDDNLNNNFAENLNDFFDTNAPIIDLDPTKIDQIPADIPQQEFSDSFTKEIIDTAPIQGTYKNYTIKTLMGKIQAHEIYDKIFDELGHIKMDQFEVVNELGLTQKQYDKLIDNFYQVKKNRNKKIDENQIGVVISSKFNVKAFWISITIIGIILLLIGIIVIIHYTIPSIANTIDVIINKIRNIF